MLRRQKDTRQKSEQWRGELNFCALLLVTALETCAGSAGEGNSQPSSLYKFNFRGSVVVQILANTHVVTRLTHGTHSVGILYARTQSHSDTRISRLVAAGPR